MKKFSFLAVILLAIAVTGCDKDRPIPQGRSANQASPEITASKPSGFLEIVRAIIEGIFGGDLIHGDAEFKSGYWHEEMTIKANGDRTYIRECKPGGAVCVLKVSAGGGIAAHNEEQEDGWGVGGFGYDQENEHMFMIIYRATLSQRTYDDVYADGIAEVPEDWVIQNDICNLGRIPIGYTVRAGNYEVYPRTLPTGEDVLIVVF